MLRSRLDCLFSKTLRTGCLAIADTAAGSGGVAGELEHPARFLAGAYPR